MSALGFLSAASCGLRGAELRLRAGHGGLLGGDIGRLHIAILGLGQLGVGAIQRSLRAGDLQLQVTRVELGQGLVRR